MNKNRNPRSKGNQRKLAVHICLLLGVCVWLIFQIKQSHDTKKHESGENVSHKSEIGNEAQKLGRKYLHPHSHEKFVSIEHEQEEGGGVEEDHNEDKNGSSQEKILENIRDKQNESERKENKHEADEDEEQQEEESPRRETEDGKDAEKEEMDDLENEADDAVGQDTEEEGETGDVQRKKWEDSKALVPPAEQPELLVEGRGGEGRGVWGRASRREEQREHMEDEQNSLGHLTNQNSVMADAEPHSHTAGEFAPGNTGTAATNNHSHHLHRAGGLFNMTADDSLLLLTSKSANTITANMPHSIVPLEVNNASKQFG